MVGRWYAGYAGWGSVPWVGPEVAQLWQPPLTDPPDPGPGLALHESGPVRVDSTGDLYMHGNHVPYPPVGNPEGIIFELDVYKGFSIPASPNVGDAYKIPAVVLTGSWQSDSFQTTPGTFAMGTTFSTMRASSPDASDLGGARIYGSSGLVADVSGNWKASQFGGFDNPKCCHHDGTTWYSAEYRPTSDRVVSTTPGSGPTGNNREDPSVAGIVDWISDGTNIWSVGGSNPLRLVRWNPLTDVVTTFNPSGTGTGAFRTIGYGDGVLMMMTSSVAATVYLVDPATPTVGTAVTLPAPWPSTTAADAVSISWDEVYDRWIIAFDSEGQATRGVWSLRLREPT